MKKLFSKKLFKTKILTIFTLLLGFFLVFPFSAKAVNKYKTTITNIFVQDGPVTLTKKIPIKTYNKLRQTTEGANQLSKATFSFRLKGDATNRKPYDETKTITFTNAQNVHTDEKFAYIEIVYEKVPFGKYTLTEKADNQAVTIGTGNEAAEYAKAEGKPFLLDKLSWPTTLNSYVSLTEDKKALRITLDRQSNEIGMAATMENIPGEGDLKIVKKNKDNEPLKGVEFRLIKKGETDLTKAITKTTNDQGIVEFKDLPVGTYLVTETKTVKGYNLLKDTIEVTIPFSTTLANSVLHNIDLSKAIYSEKASRYYVYELTYDVKNNAILKLPKTGAFSNPLLYLLIVAGCLMIAGAAYYNMKDKKKIPVKVDNTPIDNIPKE